MISEHISYREAVRSNTAIRKGIRNKPNAVQISNMERLAKHIFEPLREHFGNNPIRINSFFRSTKLNKEVGGSRSSQHIATNGAAIDIDDTHGFNTNKEFFDYIKEFLDFDQIIWEYGDDNNPNWVHVSYVSQFQNRKRALRTKIVRVKIRGKWKYKTTYIPYE